MISFINEMIPVTKYQQDTYYTSHGITLIPPWISNLMPCKVWDEITYPFPNFNGATVEVWGCISNFTPHVIMDVITESIMGLKLNNINKPQEENWGDWVRVDRISITNHNKTIYIYLWNTFRRINYDQSLDTDCPEGLCKPDMSQVNNRPGPCVRTLGSKWIIQNTGTK